MNSHRIFPLVELSVAGSSVAGGGDDWEDGFSCVATSLEIVHVTPTAVTSRTRTPTHFFTRQPSGTVCHENPNGSTAVPAMLTRARRPS